MLIDIKRGTVDNGDIGKMNMYLNYFKKEKSTEGNNDPARIILSTEKDEIFRKIFSLWFH